MLKHFQVWLRGSSLHDIRAESEKDALKEMREWLGVKRLPPGTFVCEIPPDYYDKIVKNNQEIGIDIINW